ncbi:MAG: hypothetical protein GY743_23280 [Planctomycetaceae bacterium]|nr:hypothetical protein [Planctomycetaceae bacterium]
MARASIPTLLSLDRYAEIMGINPAHFNGAAANSLSPAVFPINVGCTDVWYQHAWQRFDVVSREEIAEAIYDAEKDIEAELGYSPAPKWVTNEVHQYPRPFYRGAYGIGLNVRGQMKSIKARQGSKFIQAGRRGATLVGTATTAGGTLVYSDPDGDGFSELATITLTTTVTDTQEIGVYTAGKSAAKDWGVRPLKSVAISGGSVTITLESWKLIDPDLWEFLPTSTTDASGSLIDISTTANFVTSIDVYRIFTDFTEVSATFYWERDPIANQLILCSTCGGTGCESCTLTTQNGCIHVRNVQRGYVVAVPASYDASDARWEGTNWTYCREPDQVKIWYYAGELDERYLSNETDQPLSNYWAHTIAWLATARTKRPFCACGGSKAKQEWLRRDFAEVGGPTSFTIDADQLANPFGTTRGAIMAWQRVSKLNQKQFSGAAI